MPMSAAELADLDRQHLWHPFTQQQGWSEEDFPIIERAEDTTLYDTEGNAYIDGVSSLWCNVHGHRHPAIDAAIKDQLDRVAHTTMLGLSHAPAAELAKRLVDLAPEGLSRVFFSDNGSTACEIALKMAYQFHHQRGEWWRSGFVCLRDSYHGDTLGSVSVGGIELFHSLYRPLLFDAWQAAARRRRGAARAAGRARRALRGGHRRAARAGRGGHPRAPRRLPARRARAVRRVRPLPHLRRGRHRLRAHGHDVRLRARGRGARPHVRGQGAHRRLPAAGGDADDRAHLRGLPRPPRAVPHLLPRPHLHAATRWPARRRWRRCGSSSTSTRSSACSRRSTLLGELLAEHVERLPAVREVRRRGFMVGIELEGFPLEARIGHQVTLEARARGAIIRPLGDTVVLMPPLSIQPAELRRLVEITAAAIAAAAGAQAPRRGRLSAAAAASAVSAAPPAASAARARPPARRSARSAPRACGDLDEAHGHRVQAPAAAPLAHAAGRPHARHRDDRAPLDVHGLAVARAARRGRRRAACASPASGRRRTAWPPVRR